MNLDWNMKRIGCCLLIGMLLMMGCHNKKKPNYQLFPDMYEPIGYEAYQESPAFRDSISALKPPEGTIHRGWNPYAYPNTNEGYQDAKLNLISPLDSIEVDFAKGQELYGIYCAVCHGNRGDGQGILMEREKFLGIPSYADRDITPGSTYHVIFHGINAMGSHAGQLDEEERWQVTAYVMELKNELEIAASSNTE